MNSAPKPYVPKRFTTSTNNTDPALVVEQSHSQWPIPIVQPNISLDELRLGHLVKRYEEGSLEPEDV
jgi:hypothetical protein